MIQYFVQPQQDEAFYSLIARYQEHLNLSTYKLNMTLFGSANLRHNIVIPKKLAAFSEKHGSKFGLTYQILHDNHTLLPLLKKFDQKFVNIQEIKEPTKLLCKSFNYRWQFKYCPICFKESLSAIGEPYWNRLHNIPHIQICLLHKVKLEAWIPSTSVILNSSIQPASTLTISSNPCYVENSVVLNLTAELIASLYNDFTPSLENLILIAKETGVLVRRGIKFIFNNRHHLPLNLFIKEATLDNAEDAIEILRDIRSMLFQTNRTVNPYSFLIILAYLNNHPKSYVLNNVKKFEGNQDDLKTHRATWENELNSTDFISVSASTRKLRKVYRWLMKNDAYWLIEINKKKRSKCIRHSTSRLKISKSDDQILNEIKEQKKVLLASKFEKRISKTLIQSLPKFKYLTTTALDRLPKTSFFLKNNLETKFEFKKRKIMSFMDSNPKSYSVKRNVQIKFTINRNKLSEDHVVQLKQLLDGYYGKRSK